MAITRCPLCGSTCIVKMVAMEDEEWCKVDVCQLCQTMYPRGRTEVVILKSDKARARASGRAAGGRKARAASGRGKKSKGRRTSR